MDKPTVFISSTIYDFRDLRSALKFYLEEQGFRVLASEFNDFKKPLEAHSYEACLRALHSADYCILLVGSRVGGWYDQNAEISITQREYREAYQLQQAGKLKLLSFVRSEVWQAKEDRRELIKFLETTDLNEEVRGSIANYAAKTASNAEFLMKFLNEIGKNSETSLAVKGKAVAPTGNWIHVFSGFRDIVDVLNTHVFSSVPVEDMTAKRLLRRELRDVLAQCLIKLDKASIFSPRLTIDNFHMDHPITLESRGDRYTIVGAKRWDMLSTVAMHLLGLRHIHLVVLPQVLGKPTFLEFDLVSNSFRETPVQNALVRLQNECNRFNSSNTVENISVVLKYSPRARGNTKENFSIETESLAALLQLLDRWSNIVDLCASLLRYLDGRDFQSPSLRPDSPVKGMQILIDEERPTDDDVDSYLVNS